MKKILLILPLVLMWSATWADSLQISYQRIDDSYIYSSSPDNNYGADVIIRATSTRATLLRLDSTWVDSIGSDKVVDSLTWHIRISTNGTSDTCPGFDVWKVNCWIEGTGTGGAPTTTGVSYNDWNGPNSEWGTAGCANGSDAGSTNCTDNGGYDRTATASDTAFSGVSGTGYILVNSRVSYVQAQYTAHQPIGLLLGTYAGNSTDFYSTQASSPSTNAPFVTVFYHTSTTGSGTNVISRQGVARQGVVR